MKSLYISFALIVIAHFAHSGAKFSMNGQHVMSDTSELAIGSFVEVNDSFDIETRSEKPRMLNNGNPKKVEPLSRAVFVTDLEEPRTANQVTKRSATKRVFQTVRICEGQIYSVGKARFSKEGNYQIHLISSSGLDSIIDINLIVDKLDLQLTKDVTVEKGKVVSLEAATERVGNFAFQWVPVEGLSCPSCKSTEASPEHTTHYRVYTTDLDGVCNANQAVKIAVRDCSVSIPDAFTPNADNINDVFYVLSRECVRRIAEMNIYSETGQILFHKTNFKTSDSKEGWDGKSNGQMVRSGRYPYTIKVEFDDGEVLFKKGVVQVIL